MAVTVTIEDWHSADGEAMRAHQETELMQKYGREDYEPGTPPTSASIEVFVVARNTDGEAVGCGALRRLDDKTVEIKRMYVSPNSRGTGAATAILRALEDAAVARGTTRVLLEAGAEQPDALRFYQREGYSAIERFGAYIDDETSLCFGRTLELSHD